VILSGSVDTIAVLVRAFTCEEKGSRNRKDEEARGREGEEVREKTNFEKLE